MKNDSSTRGAAIQADLATLASDIGGAASDAGHRARAFGNVQAHAARDAVMEAQEVMSRRARRLADGADDYVRAYPWGAIAAAAAVGALVALWLARA